MMRPFIATIQKRLLRLGTAGTLAIAGAAVALSAQQGPVPVAGRNVNINGGPTGLSVLPPLFEGDFNNKMQNEATCASNPLKPSDVICAYNNYSQVLELPGLEEFEPGEVTRDATIGVAQSRDFGNRWTSDFLLGASYLDTRSFPDGSVPALRPYNFHAGADATVVTTPGGLAHVSAIFFKGIDPATGEPRGSIAVTTLIDPLNDDANPSPFVFAFQRIVMLGTNKGGGTFIDKPWLTRGESKVGTCSIPVKAGVNKTVDAYPLYLAWSVFTGTLANDNNTKLYFAKSVDCGSSWSTPKQLTSTGINQAASIAVVPGSGTIYLAWRRFNDVTIPTSPTDAIVWTRSLNNGATFRAPEAIATICPFTQGTSTATFRINSFPTMTAGPNGVYVAWADRRNPVTNACTGDALIRMSRFNGLFWSTPDIIEDPMNLPSDPGTLAHLPGHHQIFPSLAFSDGTLGLSWYDFRNDKATRSGSPFGESDKISEAGLTTRHTVDVRTALATVNPVTGVPTFGPSGEVSRYLRGVRTGSPDAVQLQYNRPNLRQFRLGLPADDPQRGVPFFSDYLHLATIKQLPPGFDGDDDSDDRNPSSIAPLFFASWTENRDAVNVKLPDYKSPLSAECSAIPANTRTLDMNIYGAVVTKGGLLAYSPSGSRPLGATPRTFVVVVRNTSSNTKNVRLSVRQPQGGAAVFVPERTAEVGVATDPIMIPTLSSISRTIEVSQIGPGTLPPNRRVTVDVFDPASATVPSFTLLMNADPYPIALENSAGGEDPNITEVHTPLIDSDIRVSPLLIPSVEIASPEIDSPQIDSPQIDSAEVLNPQIDSPQIDSPQIDSPEIDSPQIDSAGIRDVSFVVQNAGNEWTSFRTRTLADIDPLLYHIQLLIWSQYNTQHIGCATQTALNQVAVNINDADVTSPDVSPSSVQNATVAVGPGETYVVTLRIRQLFFASPISDAIADSTSLVVTSEANNTGASTPPTLTLPTSLPVVAEATSPSGALVPFVVSTNEGSEVTCTPASNSTFAIGPTTVTCLATNGPNNTTTGRFTVTVVDTTAPTVSVPEDLIVEATSPSGATATFEASATDNGSAGLTPTCTPASGSAFPLGPATPVNCSATDGAGRTGEASFSVTVVDTTAPSIAAHAIVSGQATSASGAVMTYTSPATSDAVDGPGTAACAPASGSPFALGDTTVACNATDTHGNAATESTFVVRVVDTTAPIIEAHGDVSGQQATSAAGAAVAYTSPATSDTVDGAGSAACAPASGSTFALGDTTVTCNATDAHGNAAVSTMFAVHVVDTTPPSIGAHADETRQATSGAGAAVSYASPSTSDAVDGAGTAACAPASGSPFALGNTTVTCNATDAHGNVATNTTFAVHVVDTTAPSIGTNPSIGPVEATGPGGRVVTFSNPAASDAVDASVTVVCAPASGSTFAIPTTTVNCTATDDFGNSAGSSFTVTVRDTTAPSLTVPANITTPATSAAGAVVTYTAPSAADIVDTSVTLACPSTPTAGKTSGSTFPIGTTTVTCTATDDFGNATVRAFTVTVQQAQYGLTNVKNLPPAAGVTFKPSSSGTLVDLDWRFTQNGVVVNSADALPKITITGPGGYSVTLSPGAGCSSATACTEFSFKTTDNSWDTQWKPKNAAVGTYQVSVISQKTGQTFGPFAVVFKK